MPSCTHGFKSHTASCRYPQQTYQIVPLLTPLAPFAAVGYGYVASPDSTTRTYAVVIMALNGLFWPVFVGLVVEWGTSVADKILKICRMEEV